MPKYKVLMIDDDSEVLALNERSLAAGGFDVRCATSAKEGLALFDAFIPDCVLLDVMMPGVSGFQVCRDLRARSRVPIIFLTGRVSESDKVNGFLLGADDYIEKPYSLKELEVRILANIRRAAPSRIEGRLSYPPLEIDVENHRAFCDGEDLLLSRQEYDLLYMMATSDGRPVTYEEIGERVWDGYLPTMRRTVMVSMSRLRKKLEINPLAARMIETVWSKGYRFIGKRGS